jgi:1-pyrroline-5-carboxylate dehydrogenase
MTMTLEQTAAERLSALEPFKNEVIRTFGDEEARYSLEAAILRARGASGALRPLLIDGRKVAGQGEIASLNPARPGEIVGSVASASTEQAKEAVEAAARHFEHWKRTTPLERAELLLRAARAVRERRDDFNALLVLEVGKSWIEADADTAETIDFLEFYAREALRYANPPALTRVAGEENVLRYLPLGVGVVIPPWNFAFAIMAGMTCAALAAGNTVVLKPSSDAPLIAAAFVDLLHEVGLPPGVLNFTPGSGRAIGDALVAHPKTRFIAFTGSKEVGLHVNALAAQAQPGQIWVKRVIAEMGGKDGIIVAADADLDAAADGVIASAFGFQGQKCSACSRVIVDAAVYDGFLARLVERAKNIVVGDPVERRTYMGPVINEKAMRSILSYIEKGVAEGGRLLHGGKRVASMDGFFVEPTIIADVAPRATIALEEIFGPVLAVIKVRDYDEALAVANNTEFGLTGSVYTSDTRKQDRARDEFHVGNLYFNRKSTGALVGAHPFGGFNMSGTDSKAGGFDYLMLFSQAKLISKRISG